MISFIIHYLGRGGTGGAGLEQLGVADVACSATIVGGIGGSTQGTGGQGVLLEGGGSISNNAGLIIGGEGGARGSSYCRVNNRYYGVYRGGNGGAGVVAYGATQLSNSGAITGGAGHLGDQLGAGGGAGGAGVDVSGTIGNTGSITGGAGGAGGSGGYASGAAVYAAGNGGYGGIGVIAYGFSPTSIDNVGSITGGAGGAGGADRHAKNVYDHAGPGGVGGVGVALGKGVLDNQGAIFGGAGGAGGQGYAYSGGRGETGGAGVWLFTASLMNSGVIAGGGGGAGGYGALAGGTGGFGGDGLRMGGNYGSAVNLGLIEGGAGGSGGGQKFGSAAAGAGGVGVYMRGGNDQIFLTNGSASVHSATISGRIAVYGSGTVTNFGTLVGESGVSVQLISFSRLIAEAGSTFIGAVNGGGGGALELAGGSGTISGLGSNGTVSGSEGITFSGFGAYVIDAGGSWTLSGTNALSAYRALDNYGTLTGNLVFGAPIDLSLGAGSYTGTVSASGGILSLVSGNGVLKIGGQGSVSGGETAHFSGFSYYIAEQGTAWRAASVILSARQELIARGAALTLSGAVTNYGTIEADSGGRILFARANVSAGGAIEVQPTSTVIIDDTTLQNARIVSSDSGRVLFEGHGNMLIGGGVTGSAELVNGADLTLADAIAVTEFTLFASSQQTAVTIANAGVTLDGGVVQLSNSTHNAIVGQSGQAVLTNEYARIIGAGDIGGGQMTLINKSGSIVAFGSAGLTIDTSVNTITNAGLIEAYRATLTIASPLDSTGKLETVAATLTIAGAVTGSGTAEIVAGGAIVAENAFSENVGFFGGTGSLTLFQSVGYGGTIQGFSSKGGTSLDLRDVGFVSSAEATYTRGVLTVTDGARTAHMRLAGNYSTAIFVAASDGHGGTLVTTQGSQAAAFASAMATLGAGGVAAPVATAPSNSAMAILAKPGG